MQEIPLKVIYFERGLSKSLKKGIFFSLLNPVLPIDKTIKNKRGLKLVTSRSSGYKTSSCINQINNSFISYVLSDEV